MKTYFEVAEACGLQGITRERYVKYMLARWADNQEIQCRTGYAAEWAQRFLHGQEYGASDSTGQMVLLEIDRHTP